MTLNRLPPFRPHLYLRQLRQYITHSGRLVVFGSVARASPAPRDVDVCLIAPDDETWPTIKDKTLYYDMRLLWGMYVADLPRFDPYVLFSNALVVPDVESQREWKVLDNPSIKDAIRRNGRKLRDL